MTIVERKEMIDSDSISGFQLIKILNTTEYLSMCPKVSWLYLDHTGVVVKLQKHTC